ncbi:hypothetical protein J2W91_002840 [Paenibacillus amylolyticus]|uniref:Uncharacterized protein n=1 Tax=Paenibacillus amylolyticus TaxID=1451 RepID=A0AAP5LMA5_PAEAM|nr:hypothetical protein [Paenibacillus amylolyticus]
MDRVSSDMVVLRKDMRDRGIKILSDIKDKEREVAVVQYKCRGYDREFRMLYGYLKSCTEEKLTEYLDADISKISR